MTLTEQIQIVEANLNEYGQCNITFEEYNYLKKQIRADAIDEFKSVWDERVKDLIHWCKDKRLLGLTQADEMFDEIAEQLKEQK